MKRDYWRSGAGSLGGSKLASYLIYPSIIEWIGIQLFIQYLFGLPGNLYSLSLKSCEKLLYLLV
jgi:hypothetical protein